MDVVRPGGVLPVGKRFAGWRRIVVNKGPDVPVPVYFPKTDLGRRAKGFGTSLLVIRVRSQKIGE
jgi:hypothetical protein